MSEIKLLTKRKSGQTTAIILSAISDAILNEGEYVTVNDHFLNTTRRAHKFLGETVEKIIKQLDLDIEVRIDHDSVQIKSLLRPIYEGSDGKAYREI